MLISKRWLQQFVTIPKKVSDQDLADLLTMHTVEIEGVQNMAEMLDKIVVGKIATLDKHPNANALSLCTVDFGEANPVQVVCGGSNLSIGQNVALGLVGAKVRWHGEGDLIELKPAKIRDIKSYGMICAAEEIGLGGVFPTKDEKEILDLGNINAKPGTPLADALGLNDIVFDVDNKSMTHRPDLWGHYGIAREIAALTNQPLKPYEPEAINANNEKQLSVTVKEADLCPRYMGLMIDGITVEPSPAWIQQALAAVNINPINNIVDITNFVMLELGQPMHAFDADLLHSPDIIVRKAKDKEPFVALGETEHELEKDMLVIADKKHVIAVAGVKGSNDSGIQSVTKTIILEAANFNPVSVRRTAAALSLRTDASTRFEKSLDPNATELAMRRAVELILEICPNAKVVSNLVDEKEFHLDQGPIDLDIAYVKSRIGAEINKEIMVDSLTKLGFDVADQGERLSVTIPTWRATKDISIAEDLVEEIARLYGYNNIPAVLPAFDITPAPVDPLRTLEKNVRNILAFECGYTEVSNYSFVSGEWVQKLGDTTDKHIKLDNPIAKDRPFLRRNLVPGLLQNIESNLHRFETVSIFEIGRTFIAEETGEYADSKHKDRLPKQDTYLGLAFAAKDNNTPFFEAKQALDTLANRLGLTFTYKKAKQQHPLVHPGRYAQITLDKKPIGRIAEVHPLTAQTIGLDARTAIVQVNLSTLVTLRKDESTYTALPQYPAVSRDLAFTVPAHVEHTDVVKHISAVNNLITHVELFDVYQGEHVDAGHKSMAYHIEYRSDKKTLESAEVEKIHEQVVSTLERKVGATIRS